MYSDSDWEPPAVTINYPSQTLLLADSVYRSTQSEPRPTDFSLELSTTAQGCRRISHRELQWTQPIWTHNKTDWEIILSFSNDDHAQKYVGYCYPYNVFTSFSERATDATADWLLSDTHSYCYMIRTMLRTGLRKIENPYTPDYPAFALRFECRYSKTRGLVIYLNPPEDPEDPTIYFKVYPCSWLSPAGHNIHGFGVLKGLSSDQGGSGLGQQYTMEDSLFASGTNRWFSSSPPHGIYTRYLSINSPEISANKKITSFSNSVGFGIGSGEVNVFSTIFDHLNQLKKYSTDFDPTIINLREGTALQHIRITMLDEFGHLISSGVIPGNPIDLYAAWLTIQDLPPAYDLTDTIYKPPLINAIAYDNNVITAVLKDEYSFFKKYEFDDARIDSSTPVAHLFEVVML